MIRQFVTPRQTKISIDLPKEFVGKQVEVIAFTIEKEEKINLVEEPILTHYASEKILASDWLTEEEENAWKDL